MPEYRTTDGTEPDDSGGFDMDAIMKTVVKRIQSDPESQAAVASALNENYGIPPDVMAPFLPAVRDALNGGNEAAEAPAEPTAEPTEANDVPMPQETPDPTDSIDPLDAMTADDVKGFLDEVLQYVDGDDMTVQEMRDYAAENPGIVETALKMA